MAATEEEQIRTVTLSPWAGTRVTALIGFAFGLAVVLIFLMTGGGQALLHRTVIVHTYMADGTGLIRAANVELNGIKVGKVKLISFSHYPDAARAIQVDMRIRKDYLSAIPIDSKVELTADNLLGDKYINITKGASRQTIEPDADLATQPPAANFNPGDLMASLQNILERASALLGQAEDPKAPLGQFVKGEDFYSKLRDYIVGVQTTFHKYDNPQSELGKSIYGQTLYREMQQRLLDIDKQIEQVQQNPWLAKSTQYDAWLTQAKTFRQSVVAFRETPMMKQDDFYNNTRDALKSLDETVRAMAAEKLLTSTELYESLNGPGRNMRDFLKDFRQNPRKYMRLKVF